MNTLQAAQDLRGRDVSFAYDCASQIVTIEYGRSYDDPLEADFMGDALQRGNPNGYIFTGVVDFHSSNLDSSCVGRVESAKSESENFRLQVSGPLGADISFRFQNIEATKAK